MAKPVAIFLTDTHKKKDNLDLVFDIFIQALDLAEENECKYVIHGGDFFTDRVGQNLQNLLLLHKILIEFKRRDITLLAIPGNHDKTNQESKFSYLSIYKSKHFKLFSQESTFEIGKLLVGFMPYFSESIPERLKRLNEMHKEKDPKYSLLVAHFSFNGVRNNDGSEVEDGISVKKVKVWTTVAVGHYHDASFIPPNVYYTGSAYQSTFGENSEDKGFQIIYSDATMEFAPSKFRKYIKVKLDINDDIENELEVFGDLDANVRFVFSGKKADISKVDTKKLEALGIDTQFEWDEINEEILKAESGEFGAISKASIVKYYVEYCKAAGIPKDKRAKGLKLLTR